MQRKRRRKLLYVDVSDLAPLTEVQPWERDAVFPLLADALVAVLDAEAGRLPAQPEAPTVPTDAQAASDGAPPER